MTNAQSLVAHGAPTVGQSLGGPQSSYDAVFVLGGRAGEAARACGVIQVVDADGVLDQDGDPMDLSAQGPRLLERMQVGC